MRRIVCLSAALGLVAAAAHAQPCDTLDFEDLALGMTYSSGDMFTTRGVDVSVGDFFFNIGPCGGGTTSGFTEVEAGGLACGAGQELEINNVLLEFDFGGPATGVVIPYGEYGGQVDLGINGDCQVVADFADLHNMNLGGVMVSVMDAGQPGQGCGEITLTGIVSSLEIGGQELWIDNLFYCQGETPTEAATWSQIKALYD